MLTHEGERLVAVLGELDVLLATAGDALVAHALTVLLQVGQVACGLRGPDDHPGQSVAVGLGDGDHLGAALLGGLGQRVGEQARGSAALAEHEHALAVEVAGGRCLGSGCCGSGGGVGLHGLGSSAGGNALGVSLALEGIVELGGLLGVLGGELLLGDLGLLGALLGVIGTEERVVQNEVDDQDKGEHHKSERLEAQAHDGADGAGDGPRQGVHKAVHAQEVDKDLEDPDVGDRGKDKRDKEDGVEHDGRGEQQRFVDGEGNKEDIQARIAQIKAQLEETTSDFDKEKLQERLAKLAGGVAVIRVGAATETEMKEAKLRMEDALNATRAAVEEGIIAGGGSAYIHASKEVAKLAETLEGDEKTGAKVVLKALEAPLFHISANAGLEGAVIINKVREAEPGNGFDAYNEEYVDMVKAGILDPAKVTRSALQNATSVASTLLTTESVVANIKEDAPAMPAGGAPGMGMM